MSIDSVGNFLTIIRNGLMIGKRKVVTPYSNLTFGIAKILKEEGFVKDCEKVLDETGKKPTINISLKYVNGESVIHEIKRVSKPSRRRYEGTRNMTPVIGGLGISILSTNQGIITDKKAQDLSVGGEVLCSVW
jgi:small subunit ribosomal protein S8